MREPLPVNASRTPSAIITAAVKRSYHARKRGHRPNASLAGMCAGFPAGGIAHHLVNRTDREVVYLEIGDRTAGDEGSYPRDDLKDSLGPDGRWVYTHKDGTPY